MSIRDFFNRIKPRKYENDEEDDEKSYVDGERSLPSVNKGRSIQSRLINYGIIAFVILLAALLLSKYYSALFAKMKERSEEGKIKYEQKEEAGKKQNRKATAGVIVPPLGVPPAYASNEPVNLKTADASGNILDPPPPPGEGLTASGERKETPAERRMLAPVLYEVGNTSQRGIQAGNENENMPRENDLLRASYTPPTNARLLEDRDFTIAKGTFLDCVMETALDSTVPGMTSCILTRDIYGDSGNVVLMDKGTKLTGEYKGDLKEGQARIFILWTRAKTPHGVLIDLDSPGTDSLGRSGVSGYIDRHFWERFGAAILLSIIDDALATAANIPSRGHDNVITYNSTSQNASNMATETLKQMIKIPPTLRKNHGDHVNVFIARDLNFRDVYSLKADR